MTKLLRDEYYLGLLKLGESEVKRLTGCIVMSRHIGLQGFYYIGKGGSLRFGQTRATSIPCGQKFKDHLLTLARQGE